MAHPISTACRSALAAAIAGTAVCCGPKAEPPAPRPATPVVLPPPSVPRPPPPLGRAEVLQALDAAASAYAGGPALAADVADRRFSIRQAFGCVPPTPADAIAATPQDGRAQVTRASDGGALILSLQPADWAKAPMVAGADGAWEAVEGFWLPRPWLRQDECPAPSQATPPPAALSASASPETAGVAAVFAHGSSRLDRREGRAFRHVVRGEAPVQAPPDGYRLVLEGRFTAFPDGRAIHCTSPSPDIRPTCIAAAEIDRIAFEDTEGNLLSEWRRG